jgi:DNA-binding Xre family transcriptional regulator
MRNSPLTEAVGHAIKVLRTERQMERKDLADASGVSYPYLSEIENGRKRASTQALESIAQALGVRPHQLLAWAEARTLSAERGRPEAPAMMAASAPMPSRSPMPGGFRQEAIAELVGLIEQLSAQAVERVLDLARRLAR